MEMMKQTFYSGVDVETIRSICQYVDLYSLICGTQMLASNLFYIAWIKITFCEMKKKILKTVPILINFRRFLFSQLKLY